MKLLGNESITALSAEECEERLVSAVPLVMKVMRKEMRNSRPSYISLPQFRVLAFIRKSGGASLSTVAEHIGTTLPTTSKLVDGLVKRDLVLREFSETDRRRMVLTLTEAGCTVFEASCAAIQPAVAGMLSTLGKEDICVLGQAAEIIQRVFAGERNSTEAFSANNDASKAS